MVLPNFLVIGTAKAGTTSFERRFNVSKDINTVPKNETLHNFLMHSNGIKDILKTLVPQKFRRKLNQKIRQANLKKVAEPLSLKLSPETRKQLTKIYREDILQLQELLNRDLSHWLE